MLSFKVFSFNYWQASSNHETVLCKCSEGRQAAAVVAGSSTKEKHCWHFPNWSVPFVPKDALPLLKLFSELTYSYQVHFCWEVIIIWPKPVERSFSKCSKKPFFFIFKEYWDLYLAHTASWDIISDSRPFERKFWVVVSPPHPRPLFLPFMDDS